MSSHPNLPVLAEAPNSLMGQRVRIHWNIHRKAYSVALKVRPMPGTALRWVVKYLVSDLFLKDVSFKGSIPGWHRAKNLGEKVVHTWVDGTVCPDSSFYGVEGDIHEVTYNPKAVGQLLKSGK